MDSLRFKSRADCLPPGSP